MLHVRSYCILTNSLSIGCRSLCIIFEDWVDPTSMLGVIYVIHAQLGEATKIGISYHQLLNNRTFDLEAICALPTPSQSFAELEPLPFPDMHTSESIHSKLFTICLFCYYYYYYLVMKATIGSKFAHIQWFI